MLRYAVFFLLTLLAVPLGALRADAQDSYRIRPGDSLRIEVIEDNTLNRTVLVSPDGRISLPLAGSIAAAGRTVEGVQAALAAALAPNFAAEPSVFVAVASVVQAEPLLPMTPPEPVVLSIYVLGEVSNPGRLQVEPGTTVLQLFAQAGGFSRFAATRRIQLRRTDANGTETIYTIDYDAILAGRSPNGTASLAEGDVIVVPERRLFE